MGDRLTVGPQTLNLLILVRIQVPQQDWALEDYCLNKIRVKSIVLWLVSQLPGIGIGFIGLFATSFVNELFTKRAEKRKSKEELIDKLSKIFIESEEEMWKNEPINEKDFIRYCRQLSQYNFKLADAINFNYYVLWVGVWADSIESRSKWSDEKIELHDGSIKDLKEFNNKFLDWAYPNKNFLRSLYYKHWRFRYMLKIILKKVFSLLKMRDKKL